MTLNIKYLALFAAFLLPASAFALSTATFTISKNWIESGAGSVPVSAHLSCTGVTPGEQDVVFTENTNGVLIVENIDIANGLGEDVDCTITETVPANHTAFYDADSCAAASCSDSNSNPVFDGCFFADVDTDGNNVCIIENTPDPASVTVFKDWTVAGGDQGFDGDYQVEITCDGGDGFNNVGIGGHSGIVINSFTYCSGDGPNDHCDALINSSFDQGNGWVEFTLAAPMFGGTCVVDEFFDDSVIDSSNDCDEAFDVGAGADIECHIDNTVFFEGIPTLSQYGMAILALLMLGVGFVGFRRFV